MRATNALFTLAFAAAPGSSPLAIRSTHKLASSFFNRHAVEANASSTRCRHTVSDLFHSPYRGAFHLSLTVLFTIGLWKYLALPVSSGTFIQAIRVLNYSRTIEKSLRFR